MILLCMTVQDDVWKRAKRHPLMTKEASNGARYRSAFPAAFTGFSGTSLVFHIALGICTSGRYFTAYSVLGSEVSTLVNSVTRWHVFTVSQPLFARPKYHEYNNRWYPIDTVSVNYQRLARTVYQVPNFLLLS